MASVYARSSDSASPPIARLLSVFARDANLTFGGGSATAETLRREVVERRGWLSNADFRLAFAASKLTPATNLLALCVALGWRLRGGFGAVGTLVASSVPNAILAAVVMAGYQHAIRYTALREAARGAVAVAAALLLSSVWALVRPHVASGARARAVLIVAASWAAHAVVGLSPFVILAAAGLVGAVWIASPES